MSESPPLEATGEHQAMGATSVDNHGIKGAMAKDVDQRKGKRRKFYLPSDVLDTLGWCELTRSVVGYFGGGEQLTSQQPSAGADVEKVGLLPILSPYTFKGHLLTGFSSPIGCHKC